MRTLQLRGAQQHTWGDTGTLTAAQAVSLDYPAALGGELIPTTGPSAIQALNFLKECSREAHGILPSKNPSTLGNLVPAVTQQMYTRAREHPRVQDGQPKGERKGGMAGMEQQ